jgi:predicted regulator of Ras-like GTPase activity (Roadblock/LC7/MglB family)
MKLQPKLIFSGSPAVQAQATAKLLASGKEQVRLVKELGEPSRILYEAKIEYGDMKAPGFYKSLENSVAVFLLRDKEGLARIEELFRTEQLNSLKSFAVITLPELATLLRERLPDSPLLQRIFSFSNPSLYQVAHTAVQLIAPYSRPMPPIEVSAFASSEETDNVNRETQLETVSSSVFSITTKEVTMANINESLQTLMSIEGALGACIVDSSSGMVLGKSSGSTINLDIAAAGNTEVLRAKQKTMKALGMTDAIEDILITLGQQIHILRPMKSRPSVFLYIALDKSRSNLALARMKTADADDSLVL